MSVNLYAVALAPALLGLIVLEALIARRLGRDVHRHGMGASNLAVAAGQRAFNSLTGLAPLLGYPWLVEQLGLWSWSPGVWWHWAVAFLVVDLGSYVRHWLSHRVGLLWAIHAVHHQSEDYNLTAGLRLSWVQEGVLIAIPAAVVGIPFEMALGCYVAVMVWQFLVHTELVGRLGVLDRVLMTPSSHRVHHGRNPEYLDKNLGGVLTVWDHLFGTFALEEAPVDYGTVVRVRSTAPVTGVVQPFAELWAKAQRAPSWGRAAAVLWMPPEWEPAATGHGRAAGRAQRPSGPGPVTAGTWLAVIVAVVAALGATAAVPAMTPLERGLASLAMLGLLVGCGALLTRREGRQPIPRGAVLALAATGCLAADVDPACLREEPALELVPDDPPGAVYLGPQGGYHVGYGVRATGTDRALTIDAWLVDEATGEVLGGSTSRARLGATESACTLEATGMLALLDVERADEVAGREARLEIEVEDEGGRTAAAVASLILEVGR